jgi:hypothetical protein
VPGDDHGVEGSQKRYDGLRRAGSGVQADRYAADDRQYVGAALCGKNFGHQQYSDVRIIDFVGNTFRYEPAKPASLCGRWPQSTW